MNNTYVALCAKHYPKYFKYINSFHPHDALWISKQAQRE